MNISYKNLAIVSIFAILSACKQQAPVAVDHAVDAVPVEAADLDNTGSVKADSYYEEKHSAPTKASAENYDGSAKADSYDETMEDFGSREDTCLAGLHSQADTVTVLDTWNGQRAGTVECLMLLETDGIKYQGRYEVNSRNHNFKTLSAPSPF